MTSFVETKPNTYIQIQIKRLNLTVQTLQSGADISKIFFLLIDPLSNMY